MAGNAEVQKAYAGLKTVQGSQEQFVKDMNSLTDRPDYDYLVDLCYRHMKQGSALQERTITFVKGFFRVRLQPRVASDLLDLILENVQKGHYAKFADDGAGFALSALPNSMRIHWKRIRVALLEASLDGDR